MPRPLKSYAHGVLFGRGYRKIARCESSMLRPLPKHGMLWMHNDDDNDEEYDVWVTLYN